MSEDCIPDQAHGSGPQDRATLVLVVPKGLVKAAKTALEQHESFDRAHGISPEPRDADLPPKEQRMRLHTTIPYMECAADRESSIEASLLAEILHGLEKSKDVTVSYSNPNEPAHDRSTTVTHNPLRRAVREALEALPAESLNSLKEHWTSISIGELVAQFPESYSIYTPLLLLPASSVSALWMDFIRADGLDLRQIWAHIAAALHCTHIALNHPIPPSNSSSGAHHQDSENILRSPVNLTPVYGSFGPAPTPQTLTAPTAKDFENTLWVRTRQNGIHQTWAPRYTMFSRGNVKEKARILSLPSVISLSPTTPPHMRETPLQKRATRTSQAAATKQLFNACAVDLYAGIGYFAFSYAFRGLRVLCWELNPWSIEGLMRGAALNNWTARLFTPSDVPAPSAPPEQWTAWRHRVVETDQGERFCIFGMSNDTAPRIVECLGDTLPPIRHVNLGLLPVSRLSWASAVGAVDGRLGGWVHAHENVGVGEMDERRVEVEKEFQRLADERDVDGEERGRKVRVEHVEKVKMYAPGVVHAVFDVHIPGTQIDE